MKQQGRVHKRDVRRPRSYSNTQLLTKGKTMLMLPKQIRKNEGFLSILMIISPLIL